VRHPNPADGMMPYKHHHSNKQSSTTIQNSTNCHCTTQ